MGNPNTDIKNVVADALEQSYVGSFANGLRAIYGMADNVILGITDHGDYDHTHNKIKEDDTMVALAESAVSQMFFELPIYRQNLIKKFQEAVGNPDIEADAHSFAKHFENDDTIYMSRRIPSWNYSTAITYNYLKNYLAPILTKSEVAGIDVHAVDLKGAWFKKIDMDEECSEVKPAKKKFLESKDRYGIESLETEKSERKYHEESAECSESSKGYIIARHSDFNVAQTINGLKERAINDPKKQDISDIKKEQNSLIVMGAVHGSQKRDFEEYLDGDTVKVDFPANYNAYIEKYGIEVIEDFNDLVPTIGEDPPDLVYLIDEGVWMTTTNTPKDIADLFQSSGDFQKVDSVEAAVTAAAIENNDRWSMEIPAYK